ncbi:regulatory iron-sulfur-containing complex subunit RicT [Flaviaesturariibacter amylovorans]|uniref:PSP1 C-terminal domain-containing protein n=1 Tax=Flaviaesturariibacter amylovorans TaxID=1084520 RepID=A0ABP8G9S3_9BACT
MGCGNCGSKSSPNGCKSNGSCGTNSCNRLNTYDWLVNLPIVDNDSYCRVVEVTFADGARKDFFRNTTVQYFAAGDIVAVEGVSGFDVGEISLTGETVRLQLKKKGVKENAADMKKVLRRASERDIELARTNKSREKEALIRTRAIVRQLKLNMKVSQIEIQADGKKATFFYIADDRVDFRELIKILAGEFKVKVEMRQIGARQEAGKVGGIGSCGRELCCATWLTEFKSVNTAAARYQNLSINQTKLSGQCGRLKCCLNYELDTYLDALQGFPEHADHLRVARGNATLIKKDIFKNLMWYVLPDSNKQHPLTIERVKEIKALNSQGIVPEELGTVEVVSSKAKEVEPEFVDVVGHISLRSLEKADKKRRDRRRGEQQQKGGGQQQGGNDRGGNDRGGRGGRGGRSEGTPKAALPAPAKKGDVQPGDKAAPQQGRGRQQQQGGGQQKGEGGQGQQQQRPPRGQRGGGGQQGQQAQPNAEGQQGGQAQGQQQGGGQRGRQRNNPGAGQQGGGEGGQQQQKPEGGQQQRRREPRAQQGGQEGGGENKGRSQEPRKEGDGLRSRGSRRRREGEGGEGGQQQGGGTEG